MNHDVIIYIISMLATIFFISSIILAALLYESKQKEKEIAEELARDREVIKFINMPIPEPKIETYRLATIHACVEADARMAEFMESETFDAYLRAELAHKIADCIKPILKIELKHRSGGLRYEAELTVKDDRPVETFTPEGGKA